MGFKEMFFRDRRPDKEIEDPEITARREKTMDELKGGKGEEGDAKKLEELQTRATEIQARLEAIPQEIANEMDDDAGKQKKSELGQEMIISVAELKDIMAKNSLAAPQVHPDDITKWEETIQRLKDQATEKIAEKTEL